MKKIYLILSHSNTIPSKIVKIFTKYNYSHISIALKKDISTMYSFGRKKYNNPFIGGFIIEKRDGLFYKKFNKTKCVVLEIDISNKQYNKLISILRIYKDNINIYKYDFLGTALNVFKINYKRENYSVCSEFVGNLLEECDIYNFNKKYIRPKDFMLIPNKKIIYEGLLLNYEK